MTDIQFCLQNLARAETRIAEIEDAIQSTEKRLKQLESFGHDVGLTYAFLDVLTKHLNILQTYREQALECLRLVGQVIPFHRSLLLEKGGLWLASGQSH